MRQTAVIDHPQRTWNGNHDDRRQESGDAYDCSDYRSMTQDCVEHRASLNVVDRRIVAGVSVTLVVRRRLMTVANRRYGRDDPIETCRRRQCYWRRWHNEYFFQKSRVIVSSSCCGTGRVVVARIFDANPAIVTDDRQRRLPKSSVTDGRRRARWTGTTTSIRHQQRHLACTAAVISMVPVVTARTTLAVTVDRSRPSVVEWRRKLLAVVRLSISGASLHFSSLNQQHCEQYARTRARRLARPHGT